MATIRLPGGRAPLRRFGIEERVPAGCRHPARASHEVRCVSECCMQPAKWVYLVPHSRSRSPFLPARSGFFLRLPSPCSLAQAGFILSYASLLFRVLPSLRSALTPVAREPEAPSLGFAVPLRDLSLPRLLPRAILVCSVPCRPRRFARPRRFPPRLALWVYFTPLPRPGFTLQGFHPRPQPYRLSTALALSSLSRLR